MAEAAGAPPDGVVAVEMAAEEDAEAGTAPAPAVLGELEHDAVEADGKAGVGSVGVQPNSVLKAGRKRSRRYRLAPGTV